MSSRNIKAKSGANETFYSGVTFRSRLEARWALFFDLVGWDWDYEPAQYRLRPGMTYEPDIYLPNQRLWVEVKGAYWLQARSIAKTASAVAGPHRIPLRSEPYGPADCILLAGDMLAETVAGTPVHSLIWDDGSGQAAVSKATLQPDGVKLHGKPWLHLDSSGVAKAVNPSPELQKALCQPGRIRGDAVSDRFANAYIVSAMPFPKTKELKLPADLAFAVSGRWAGRRVR